MQKESKYQQKQKEIHKMHVNSGDCLSKRKLFLIPALIGRYVTLLHANTWLFKILDFWLEKEHFYDFHSNLSTFPN